MGIWVEECEKEQGNEGEGGKGDRAGGPCLRFNCRNSKVPRGH